MLLNRDAIFLRIVLQLDDLVVVISDLLTGGCLEDIELFHSLDYVARLRLQVEELFLVDRCDHNFLSHRDDLLQNSLAVQLVYVFESRLYFLCLAHHFLNILDPAVDGFNWSFLLSQHVFVAQVIHLQSFDLGWHTGQVFYILLQF